MTRDLSFLQPKDGDSETIRNMKTYWTMVMEMPEPERKVFLQQERVKDEERHLQWMIDMNRQNDDFIADCITRAKSLVQDYHLFEGADDSWLDQAEVWTELAQSTKAAKYTIKDIRKQRERVQWELKKLKTMQPSDGLSLSSSSSKT